MVEEFGFRLDGLLILSVLMHNDTMMIMVQYDVVHEEQVFFLL